MIKQFILILFLILGFTSCSESTSDHQRLKNLSESGWSDPQELKRRVNLAVIELNNFAAAYKLHAREIRNDEMDLGDLYAYMGYHKPLFEPPSADATKDEHIDYEKYSPAHHYWKFRFRRYNSIIIGIESISLKPRQEMGRDHIYYDLETGEYSGYGVDLIHPELKPLLLGQFINPTYTLISGEEWEADEYAKRMTAIRQVNWGGTILPSINNSINMYQQDFGVFPGSVNELEEMEYIHISKPVLQWWEFSFLGNDPIMLIIATSTDKMILGPDWTITLDIATGSIEGSALENLSPWVEAGYVEVPIFLQYVKGAKSKIGSIYRGRKN